MRLGGEVDDRITALPGALDRLRVGDVPDDELDARTVEVRGVPRVRQLVEDDDLVATCNEPLDEVRADEPGPAGDEQRIGEG